MPALRDNGLRRWSNLMLEDTIDAEAPGDYRLRLVFEDGVEGMLDLKPHLSFQGVFEPLQDPSYFAQVRVDPDLGTVVWPNGADLDPQDLYGRVAALAGLDTARRTRS
jgi:hypothetical protein